MAQTLKKAKNVFFYSSILCSKPKDVINIDITTWIKQAVQFEEKSLSLGKLPMTIVPKYPERFQTGLCLVGFGTKASQMTGIAPFWTLGYIVTGMLGRKTQDFHIDSDIVHEKPYNFVTDNILRYALTNFVGQILQVSPPTLLAQQGWKLKYYSKLGFDDNKDGKVEGERISADRNYNFTTFGSRERIANCHSIELLHYEPPNFTIRITGDALLNCRSLVNSIGEHLGCYATISSMHMDRLGPFRFGSDPALEKYELYVEHMKTNMLTTEEKCENHIRYLKSIYPRAKPTVRYI